MSKIKELVVDREDANALKAIVWCAVFASVYATRTREECEALADEALEDFEKVLA